MSSLGRGYTARAHYGRSNNVPSLQSHQQQPPLTTADSSSQLSWAQQTLQSSLSQSQSQPQFQPQPQQQPLVALNPPHNNSNGQELLLLLQRLDRCLVAAATSEEEPLPSSSQQPLGSVVHALMQLAATDDDDTLSLSMIATAMHQRMVSSSSHQEVAQAMVTLANQNHPAPASLTGLEKNEPQQQQQEHRLWWTVLDTFVSFLLQEKNNNHQNNTSFVLAWLKLLNQSFVEQQQHASLPLPPPLVATDLLQRVLLPQAQASCGSVPVDDDNGTQEVHVQWHILTGIVCEQVLHSHSCHFDEPKQQKPVVASSTADSDSSRGFLPALGQSWQEYTMHLVRLSVSLLSQMTNDNAPAGSPAFPTTSDLVAHKIQHCLRYVTLASNALESLLALLSLLSSTSSSQQHNHDGDNSSAVVDTSRNNNTLVVSSLTSTLYQAMVDAATSTTATTSWGETVMVDNEDYVECLLNVANLALQQQQQPSETHQHQRQISSRCLSMTLLYGLSCSPRLRHVLLTETPSLWTALEEGIDKISVTTSDKELLRVVQASILTLLREQQQQQGLSSQSSFSSPVEPLNDATVKESLLERLLALERGKKDAGRTSPVTAATTTTTTTTITPASSEVYGMDEEEAWNALFERRLSLYPTPKPTSSKGH